MDRWGYVKREKTTEQSSLDERWKNRWECQPIFLNRLVLCCRRRWSCNVRMKCQQNNLAFLVLSRLYYSFTWICPLAGSILTASEEYLCSGALTTWNDKPAWVGGATARRGKRGLATCSGGKERRQKRDHQNPRGNNTLLPIAGGSFAVAIARFESRTAE